MYMYIYILYFYLVELHMKLNLVILKFTGLLQNFELPKIRLEGSEGLSKIGNSQLSLSKVDANYCCRSFTIYWSSFVRCCVHIFKTWASIDLKNKQTRIWLHHVHTSAITSSLNLLPAMYIFLTLFSYYTPRNEVVGGYTGFTMSVRPSVDKSYVVR